MLVLGARRQYGCLSHKVVSSYEQFLAVPDACQYSPNTMWNRQTRRRKQEISSVCLHHTKNIECPYSLKKLLQLLGGKTYFNCDWSEDGEFCFWIIKRNCNLKHLRPTKSAFSLRVHHTFPFMCLLPCDLPRF